MRPNAEEGMKHEVKPTQDHVAIEVSDLATKPRD